MQTRQVKYCPLISFRSLDHPRNTTKQVVCMKDGCSFWVHNQCAIVLLAIKLAGG